MRISDDRYNRDRQNMEMAVRLIRHEARTLTIRQWTGLSDDRIRKLYRTYVAHQGSRRIPRHRGKPPRQVAYFFRNPGRQFQAAQLASLYIVLDLLRISELGVESHCEPRSLPACMRLCEAYETYVALHRGADCLSFEHAWFLLLALTHTREIGVTACPGCGGVRLKDLLSHRGGICVHCEQGSLQLQLGDTPSVPEPQVSAGNP